MKQNRCGPAIVANHVGAHLDQVAAFLADDATTALAGSVTLLLAERQHVERLHVMTVVDLVSDADYSGVTGVVC